MKLIDFIEKYKDKIEFQYLSQNKNITWDIVQNNSHLPWDYFRLSMKIKYDFCTKHPNDPYFRNPKYR